METSNRNLVVGAVLAVAAAVAILGPSVFGVAAWKYVLALLGLVLVILGNRAK